METEFNVVSLFDGMGCLQISFEKLGIKPTKYFAAEIDKHCNKLTKILYPETIQLGDVRNVKGSDLGFVHFLGGGSPCQSFSFAGKQKGMSTKCEIEITTLDHYLKLKEQNFEFEGQSYLFWEYIRILKELREINPNILFLLENVVMSKKWEKVLSEAIGINPVKINSALLSAQNRKRLYWSNISTYPDSIFSLKFEIPQPKDKGIFLKDILEKEVDEKYFLSDKMIEWLNKHSEKRKTNFKKLDGLQKSSCITATANIKQNLSTDYIVQDKKDNLVISGTLRTHKDGNGFREVVSGKGAAVPARAREDGSGQNVVFIENNIRRLTPRECGRLQTVPEHILDKMLTSGISDTQLYKMFGNGWTIDVIVYILSFMK